MSLSSLMTELWKATFLPVASRRVILRSGRVMARGMPGRPPPVPMSMRRAPAGTFSRPGRRVSESTIMRDQAASRSRIAVRFMRVLASRSMSRKRARRVSSASETEISRRARSSRTN